MKRHIKHVMHRIIHQIVNLTNNLYCLFPLVMFVKTSGIMFVITKQTELQACFNISSWIEFSYSN